ncbi:hypothetical protein DI272_18650 [Streptomyces sp. Act143]|uniref:hypothetical protein n=1 Tax=Streptomyces sp. Act143 TaxID=2200760 RepID=UPI000D6801AC|nr:hypothetical protein [Streptomyces sp. Act143]PWI15956.1 hypothetical protein DI272_18650 [Streptomyces sp. Act143]
MSGTSAALRLLEHGLAEQPAPGFAMTSLAANTWADTGLVAQLPSAGTYDLDVTVRAALSIDSPANVWIVARLFDATAGVVVPRSELLVNQQSVITQAGQPSIESGDNRTASTALEYQVATPTSLRLQAAWFAASGTPKVAGIGTDNIGRTMVRFNRIA